MKNLIITFVLFTTSLFGLFGGVTFADNSVSQTCSGLAALSSSNSCDSGSQKKINKIVKTTTNLISYIVGAVAVLVLIFAGFRFITANGDQNTVNSARNMILYAIIGIAVVVLAQLIVHLTINTVSK